LSAEVRIDQGALRRLLRSRSGRAYRKLAERTERVASIAEQLAPGSMGSYVTWKVEENSKGLQGVIVCDHPAVLFVLNGTRPHLIRPRRRNGFLRFEVNGRVVYSRLVRHPGTKPNDFLGKALRLGR